MLQRQPGPPHRAQTRLTTSSRQRELHTSQALNNDQNYSLIHCSNNSSFQTHAAYAFERLVASALGPLPYPERPHLYPLDDLADELNACAILECMRRCLRTLRYMQKHAESLWLHTTWPRWETYTIYDIRYIYRIWAMNMIHGMLSRRSKRNPTASLFGEARWDQRVVGRASVLRARMPGASTCRLLGIGRE